MVDKRVKIGAALLCLLVVAAAGVYAVTVTIGNSGRFKTDTNLTVFGQSDVTVQSGNPFPTESSVKIGGVRFNGTSATAQIDAVDTGVWTNLSQIQAQSGRVDVNRSGVEPVGVAGTVDSVSVRDVNVSDASTRPDVVATAGGSWSLRVEDTGLASGEGLVVKNTDTGDILDATSVLSNGTARFTDLSSVSSATLDVRSGPSELEVYNATSPAQLVDGVTLTVRVFDQEGEVFQRTVNNGRMDLTGIPKDQPLTITVDEEDSSDFVFRRTVIESVGQQQSIYLLNSSVVQTANVVFELDDRTGNFPPRSTILFVKRPVNKDFDGDGTDETRYENVVGDTFGSGSFPTILESNQRYRLVVQNQDGRQRVIGSYTAQLNDRSVIRLTGVSIPVPQDPGFAANMSGFQEDVDGDGTSENFIRFVYRDPAKRTESLDWTLSTDSNETAIDNGAAGGPLGTYSFTRQVPYSVKNTSYELSWTAQREQDDGTDTEVSGTVWAGDVPDIPLPIDPQWLQLLGFILIVGMAGLVVIVDGAIASAAATGTAGVLTVLGIVTIPVPALALGGVVSVVAVIGRAR